MNPTPDSLRTRRAALALGAAALLSACSAAEEKGRSGDRNPPAPGAATPDSEPGPATPDGAPSPVARRPAEIPGLGPRTRATIGARTRQVLVVTGESADSNVCRAVLYERRPGAGWRPASAVWPARNGHKGWSGHHVMGDLRSPIGTFTLTDAGGRLADPGTELPYHRDPIYTLGGRNFEGEPKAGAFDYVLAIDYNRYPGRTPSDWGRPLGTRRGGGIWVHIGHGGGTEGCVGLPRDRMRELLRTLRRAARPMIVMGPADALTR
ncbi:L,D-transpeptidase family protein [Streptomyces qinzhouensis]|uniref:L,D-transpeptidase family protein n=1 Tax=Streptomyces qinzhouensis TaxID=2599401 RepID=A0A5B8JDP9_9ACTN|nr:L,D-transpeptidase family protein [Streptomyces qinzhouensis]QDY75573.1 L,D-transpeptidase family protein [Streptomyces qinzhouensis]